MDTVTKHQIETIRQTVTALNHQLNALMQSKDAKGIKVEIDVKTQNMMGRLYGLPWVQVKFSEVTIL